MVHGLFQSIRSSVRSIVSEVREAVYLHSASITGASACHRLWYADRPSSTPEPQPDYVSHIEGFTDSEQ